MIIKDNKYNDVEIEINRSKIENIDITELEDFKNECLETIAKIGINIHEHEGLTKVTLTKPQEEFVLMGSIIIKELCDDIDLDIDLNTLLYSTAKSIERKDGITLKRRRKPDIHKKHKWKMVLRMKLK